MTASKESEIALQHVAEEHLVAVRDLTKGRVEDYFTTIEKQILNLSQKVKSSYNRKGESYLLKTFRLSQ